jgi:hypothetical protein
MTLYVISSPARVGSGLIAKIINSACQPTRPTHNPFFVPPKNSIMIQVSRKDLFAAIMSQFVGKHTKEFHVWSYTKFDKFSIDCESDDSDFAHQYRWHKWFHESCVNLHLYDRVEHFWLEDYANNYDIVYDRLGFERPENIEFRNTICPYNYRDLVSNIDECRKRFDWMEEHEPEHRIPNIGLENIR